MITYEYVKEHLNIGLDRFHTILSFLGINYRIGKGKKLIIDEKIYNQIKELIDKFGDTNELTQYMKVQNSLKNMVLLLQIKLKKNEKNHLKL